ELSPDRNHGEGRLAEPGSPAAHPACQRAGRRPADPRSEEHTSELQSHRDLHSFPTRRSSDLSYHLTEITVKGAWLSPARLQLIPHVNAPVADLPIRDRKSTRLNSSPTEISTLSLHDALPI